MDVGTISSRYVKALFSLAKDKRQEDRVYDDMKMLTHLAPGGESKVADYRRRPGSMRVVHPFYPPGTSAQERELVTANGIYLYPYVPERQKDHPCVVQDAGSGR